MAARPFFHKDATRGAKAPRDACADVLITERVGSPWFVISLQIFLADAPCFATSLLGIRPRRAATRILCNRYQRLIGAHPVFVENPVQVVDFVRHKPCVTLLEFGGSHLPIQI